MEDSVRRLISAIQKRDSFLLFVDIFSDFLSDSLTSLFATFLGDFLASQKLLASSLTFMEVGSAQGS